MYDLAVIPNGATFARVRLVDVIHCKWRGWRIFITHRARFDGSRPAMTCRRAAGEEWERVHGGGFYSHHPIPLWPRRAALNT